MRLQLIKANIMYAGLSISEDACKSVVAKFKGPVPVTFSSTKLNMGKITSVEYDEETKSIYGEVELDIAVIAGIQETQSIDIPMGKRIIDGELNKGFLVPKNLLPGGDDAK